MSRTMKPALTLDPYRLPLPLTLIMRLESTQTLSSIPSSCVLLTQTVTTSLNRRHPELLPCPTSTPTLALNPNPNLSLTLFRSDLSQLLQVSPWCHSNGYGPAIAVAIEMACTAIAGAIQMAGWQEVTALLGEGWTWIIDELDDDCWSMGFMKFRTPRALSTPLPLSTSETGTISPPGSGQHRQIAKIEKLGLCGTTYTLGDFVSTFSTDTNFITDISLAAKDIAALEAGNQRATSGLA
jgi:hypothetical protein